MTILSDAQLATIAPLWGSYMNDSDPGACMYGLTQGFTSEEQARAVARFCKLTLLGHNALDPDAYEGGPEQWEHDRTELADMIETAEAFAKFAAQSKTDCESAVTFCNSIFGAFK